MRRPFVLLDCDDLLGDFGGWFLLNIEQHLGVSYRREDVTAYNFTSLPGWESIQNDAWNLCKEPGFCRNIPVFDGAKEGVRRLQKIADVEICTKPLHGAPTWTGERDWWLERHFGIPHQNVHHVRKKYRMPADYLIEDSGENCDLYAEHGAGIPLLWDKPYNQTFNHIRVFNWDDVLEHVGGKLACSS